MCSRCDDTVLRLIVSSAAISGFEQSSGEQHQHVDLAAGETGRQAAAARDAMAGGLQHGVDGCRVEPSVA